MKSLLVLCVLAGAILAISVVVEANSATFGQVGSDQKLLETINISRKSRPRPHIVEVRYPETGYLQSPLTGIRIIDRGGVNNFGTAIMKDGGPKSRFSEITLKSQRSKPMDFTIKYYGSP